MADTPKESAHFETDTVDANLAIERGQGIGARELAAQRDPGGVVTEDEDDESETGASVSPPDQSDAGKGLADDDQQLGATSDA
ncbi:MAG: hypothetical protein EON87_21195 [Brevundimonas sp.]|nr:MAG: hypothetical protein EON87_21195 [Brevundimonas sp.]